MVDVRRTVGLLVVAIALAYPASASAQNDHLQCHKITDGQKFKSAVVALTAAEAAFQVSGDCQVIGKAKEYCKIVSKSVVDPGDAPVPAVIPESPSATSDYLCYKVKCPKDAFPDEDVIDQFGARTISKIKKVDKLCVPVQYQSSATQRFAGVVTNENDPTTPGAGIGPVWSYSGQIGLLAGDAMCQAIGADHPCTYTEILQADANNELSVLSDGQQFWLHRLVAVDDGGGGQVAPGEGARCNDWTYPTGHIADSEFGVWYGGSLQFYVDGNPCYTGNAADGCSGSGYTWSAPGLGSGINVTAAGGDCGGAAYGILCCN